MSKKKQAKEFEDKIVPSGGESTEDTLKFAGEEPDQEAHLTDVEKQCLEWKEKYLRAMAEFDNFRRRSHQEKADWIKLASERLALNICDVLDNFERALMQISDEQRENAFVKGIMLIEQQLRSVLEKEGVKKIAALGVEFDPKCHEALAHIPSEYEENIVAAVIQNGYEMHGKVIRHARVAVSNGITNE